MNTICNNHIHPNRGHCERNKHNRLTWLISWRNDDDSTHRILNIHLHEPTILSNYNYRHCLVMYTCVPTIQHKSCKSIYGRLLIISLLMTCGISCLLIKHTFWNTRTILYSLQYFLGRNRIKLLTDFLEKSIQKKDIHRCTISSRTRKQMTQRTYNSDEILGYSRNSMSNSTHMNNIPDINQRKQST